MGRGIEAFLLWYAFADVPAFGLIDPNAQLIEVFAAMGDVGLDAPGLHGPGVSTTRLPELAGARIKVDAGRLVAIN